MRRGRGGTFSLSCAHSHSSPPQSQSPGRLPLSLSRKTDHTPALNCCPSRLAPGRRQCEGNTQHAGDGSRGVWPPGRGCLSPGSPGSALWCHLEDVAWAGPAGTGQGRAGDTGAQWEAALQLLSDQEKRRVGTQVGLSHHSLTETWGPRTSPISWVGTLRPPGSANCPRSHLARCE